MFLKSLEMQGFKSFPDKTELSFGRGITAVVGPNGSGKSNISDAVRWVLGETSTKSLRGSRMEDVIFGGTSVRKPVGFAQVRLTLDNSDKALKDKGDVITVSRRYYRSGESEYKIDGELVRLRDVHELFMDTGLGADGYSLVGQGKIDSIISAKNEDRRELFEEAAGISRFRHKRTSAQRRLEQAQENLVRLLDILGELESRVGPLKQQSEKAARFIELADEKKTLEIGVWVNKINKFTNELREQEHRIDAANESYSVCERELKDIERDIESSLEQTVKINAEIDALRADASAHDEQALKKDGEASVIEATISHNEQTAQRLRSDIDEASQGNASIDESIAEKRALIASCAEKSQELRSRLEQLAGSMEELSSSDKELSRLTAQLNARLASLTMSLSDHRVALTQASSGIEEIRQRCSAAREAREKLTQELAAEKAGKEKSDSQLKALEAEIEESTNAASGFRLRAQSKEKKASELSEKLSKLTARLSEKRSRANMLSDLEKNMEGYSGAVKAVIRASRSGALGGVRGVLSQLIQVENEYSTAVEVALGAAMQNIVTANEADAKRAINYLKANNLGRATFLPVSNIKGRALDEKGLRDELGFVAVASELVECSPEYSQIISNLLGRTVIADDIDSAIGIAKQYGNRFKIVTLDGQVMNPGGSMTGGSRAKGAGILSRANMIEELLEEAKALDSERRELEAQLKTAQEEASRESARLQAAEAAAATAREDLIRAEGENRLIADKLRSLEERVGELDSEVKSADSRISGYEAERDKAQKNAADVQSEIEKTEQELEKATGNARGAAQQREKLREESEQLNLQLVTIAKDSQAASLAIEELELRRTAQSGRVGEIEREIAELQSKNEELGAQILEIKKAASALRESSAQSARQIEELIAQRDELDKKSAQLRVLERNKEQEREKLSAEIVRLDERKITMRKEYDELNDMLFEQYELTRREAEALNIRIDDMESARKRLHEIKVAIKKLGSINVGAIEEYKEVSERYEFLSAQVRDVETSKSELNKIIDDLTRSMSERFLAQFSRINGEFSRCFADFFGGGKGELVLEDPDNCLECPIEIKIQPPGKSVQNINLFSGGEKSLAALALLFSVLRVQPSPFCIYDEVEAALDDVNVERFAKYMRRMTDKTQFIAITHRRGTMEEADVLYGVTMQEKGVSKLLELQSAELAAKMGLSD